MEAGAEIYVWDQGEPCGYLCSSHPSFNYKGQVQSPWPKKGLRILKEEDLGYPNLRQAERPAK